MLAGGSRQCVCKTRQGKSAHEDRKINDTHGYLYLLYLPPIHFACEVDFGYR